VTEAAVHTLLKIEMEVGFDKVGPVEMSIDTEHLAKDCLANLNELRWEAAALTNPITRPSKLRKGCVESGRAYRNGSICTRSVERTRCVSCAGDFGTISVVCERDSSRVSRENGGVVNLARDPSLHEGDILVSRNFNWLFARIQPGEGMVPALLLDQETHINGENVRASGHARTRLSIADRGSTFILVMNHTYKVPEIAVMLNNCR